MGCISSPRAWYSQEFGRRLPSTEISLVHHGAVPRISGYVLLLDSPTTIDTRSDSPTQWQIDLGFEDGDYQVRATAAGIRLQRR